MRHALSGPILAAALLLGGCAIDPEDAPWTPLSLEEPLGLATQMKLRSLNLRHDVCLAALPTAASLRVSPPPRGAQACPLDEAFTVERATVSYGGVFTASCALAAAIYVWEREVLQPAALEHLDARVTRIEHVGTYACRTVYGRADAAPSQHAAANAIDIAGFRLSDGRTVSVLRDWGAPTAEGRFLTALAARSCRVFSGVLGPAYNTAHRDHLHLDMGPYRICS